VAGHRGVDRRAGSTITRKDLEELFLKPCDDHRITRPKVNAEIGPYSPDFL
jgi:hypothetical protein